MIKKVFVKRGWFLTKVFVEEEVYYQHPEWKRRYKHTLHQTVKRMAIPKDVPELLYRGLLCPEDVKHIR